MLFKVNIFAEGKCGKKLSHSQDMRHADMLMLHFLTDTKSHFCPSNITFTSNQYFAYKNKNKLESFWKLALNE